MEKYACAMIGREKEGRRSGIERRQFSAHGYEPENRFGKDRRGGQDRRNSTGLSFLKSNLDRWMEFPNPLRGLFYATFLSLPLWTLIIFLILKGGGL